VIWLLAAIAAVYIGGIAFCLFVSYSMAKAFSFGGNARLGWRDLRVAAAWPVIAAVAAREALRKAAGR
jgi:hypothetical protein